MPVKELIKINPGKSKLLDRDVNHIAFYLPLSEEEEGEDSTPGQTWYTYAELKELAQLVCHHSIYRRAYMSICFF